MGIGIEDHVCFGEALCHILNITKEFKFYKNETYTYVDVVRLYIRYNLKQYINHESCVFNYDLQRLETLISNVP